MTLCSRQTLSRVSCILNFYLLNCFDVDCKLQAVMAVHDDVNGSIEKTSSGMDELPTFNVENLQSNMKVIYYRLVQNYYLVSMECLLSFSVI